MHLNLKRLRDLEDPSELSYIKASYSCNLQNYFKTSVHKSKKNVHAMAQGVLNTWLMIQLNLKTWKFKIHLLF